MTLKLLTKREIIKTLESKRDQALTQNGKKHSKQVLQRKKDMILSAGFKEVEEKAQAHADALLAIIEDVESNLPEGCGFKNYYCGSCKYLLEAISKNGTLLEVLATKDLSYSSKIEYSIQNEYSKSAEQIKNTYAQVIESVRVAKNSQAAVDFLAELGFNRAEFQKEEEEEITALAININKKYLFVS